MSSLLTLLVLELSSLVLVLEMSSLVSVCSVLSLPAPEPLTDITVVLLPTEVLRSTQKLVLRI